MKAGMVGVAMVVAGLVVISFSVLVLPQQGVSPLPYHNAGTPGYHIAFQGGITIELATALIGAAVLAIGLVLLIRASKLDIAWRQPVG